MFEQHLSPQALQAALRNPSRHQHQFNPHIINERVLWTYIAQLANAIKTVHAAGLAVRTIEPTKILVTGKNRLRINCCSILEVIRAEQDVPLPNQQVCQGALLSIVLTQCSVVLTQQDDLFDLGKVLVALACNSTAAPLNLGRSLEHISRTYSADVQKLVLFCFGKPGPHKTVEEVFSIMGSRILDEFNASLL